MPCEDAPCCGCCGPHGDGAFDQEEAAEAFLEARDAGDMGGDEFEDGDLDESMDGDHESALESVYGPSDMPEDIDTPMGDDYGG